MVVVVVVVVEVVVLGNGNASGVGARSTTQQELVSSVKLGIFEMRVVVVLSVAAVCFAGARLINIDTSAAVGVTQGLTTNVQRLPACYYSMQGGVSAST